MNSQQVAVVTGASTGIGAAVAATLARNGYRVALVARSEDRLDPLRETIEDAGGEAATYVTDLRDRAAVADLPSRVQGELGAVRVVANIAGVWHGDDRAYYGPLLHETATEEILEVMEVGIVAPMLLTKALLPSIIDARGAVINLSGTFSAGGSGWMHYFVSKRALEQFTVGLADELRELGVTVNCVSPADVATEAYVRFFPEDAATALAPQDVADVVQWLVSPGARHVSGQIIEVRAKGSS